METEAFESLDHEESESTATMTEEEVGTTDNNLNDIRVVFCSLDISKNTYGEDNRYQSLPTIHYLAFYPDEEMRRQPEIRLDNIIADSEDIDSNYVYVGIPCAKYKRLFKQIRTLWERPIISPCVNKSNGYAWIRAEMDRKAVSMYYYDSKSGNFIRSGNFHDKFVIFKSNILGDANFSINMRHNKFTEETFLVFVLKSFQVIELTSIKPIKLPIFSRRKPPTTDVMRLLQKKQSQY